MNFYYSEVGGPGGQSIGGELMMQGQRGGTVSSGWSQSNGEVDNAIGGVVNTGFPGMGGKPGYVFGLYGTGADGAGPVCGSGSNQNGHNGHQGLVVVYEYQI